MNCAKLNNNKILLSPKLWVLVLTMLLAVSYASYKTELLITKTASLPYKVFLLVKNSTFKKYDYVAIKHHNTTYYGEPNMVKQIIGISGDLLVVEGKDFYINGIYYGKIKNNTSHNKPLTAIKTQFIPKDHVFAYAPHIDSFDSRYQELGFVPTAKIRGRAYALF